MSPSSVRYHPKREVAADVLTLARERTSWCFDEFDHVAVSFSGGKDSTVVLNLAIEEAERRGVLPLRVVHYDEEAIPYQTEEYVRRVYQDPRVELEWLCLPVKHRNACSRREPFWWPWAPEAEDRWVRPLPEEGITSLPGFPTGPPLHGRHAAGRLPALRTTVGRRRHRLEETDMTPEAGEAWPTLT